MARKRIIKAVKNKKLKVEIPDKTIQKILDLLSMGVSVRMAAKEVGLNNHLLTLFRRLWSKDYKLKYFESKAMGVDWTVDGLEDRIEEIKDKDVVTPEEVALIRLLVDTVKWKACKLNPKIYGDSVKLDAESELRIRVLSTKDIEKKENK